MPHVIIELEPNDAYCYEGHQTRQCITLSEKLNQTIHNVTKKVKANNPSYLYRNQTKRCTILLGK